MKIFLTILFLSIFVLVTGCSKKESENMERKAKKIVPSMEKGKIGIRRTKKNSTHKKRMDKREVKGYHENGQIKFERKYLNNKLDGVWTEWYENGVKKSECEYKKGKRHGKRKTWDQDGDLRSEKEYKNGWLHGTCIDYHKTGEKKRLQEWEQGKWHGKFIKWDKDGFILKEKLFKKNVLVQEY